LRLPGNRKVDPEARSHGAGARGKPRFGTMKDRIVVNGPNWSKPGPAERGACKISEAA